MSADQFHAAVLRSLGITPERDAEVAEQLFAALHAKTGDGAQDWRAILTATDQYFKLRGAYAKIQRQASDRPQRHTVDVAPWLRALMEARAQSNGSATPVTANTAQPIPTDSAEQNPGQNSATS
jgi:hypothetical protein